MTWNWSKFVITRLRVGGFINNIESFLPGKEDTKEGFFIIEEKDHLKKKKKKRGV